MKRSRIPLPLIIYYAGLFFLLAGYILMPMLNTIAKAFHFGEGFTFSVFRDYLQNANNLHVLRNTVTLGLLSVLCCGLVGTLLALYLRFAHLRWKRLLHISPLLSSTGRAAFSPTPSVFFSGWIIRHFI